MTKLTTKNTPNVSMVGKKITPIALADRMPSADIAAKVGSDNPSMNSGRRVIRIGA